MARTVEKKPLTKGKAFFNLVGKVKRNDWTFKMNEVSQSGYKYSRINLGIETKAGNTVYCEAMGGFFTNKDAEIYVSSKDDIKDNYTIDWADRFDEKVLETIHASKFIKIGVEQYEKNEKKYTITKKFLSWFDAIEYLNQHLTTDMVVSVSGNLKYSMYKDTLQVKKEIKSIFLSDATEDNFKSSFTQSILIDRDCVSDYNKETDEIGITARVVDYTKMWGDKEVKQLVPYYTNYIIKDKGSDVTEKLITHFFKVKKGITELAVEGEILEGTPIAEVTEKDIPKDMRELIDIGLYTTEEVLAKMLVKGPKISQFVITRPYIQQIENEDGTTTTQLFKEEEKFTDDDLMFDFMAQEDEENQKTESDETVKSSDDNWLNNL